jgi:uncharacterized protein YyaL (SSP411 family)
LYQVTFNKHWLLVSQKLTDFVIKNFYSKEQGLFYYTDNKSSNLVVRKIEIYDQVIPSSNSVMAEVLFNLSVYFENNDYFEKANLMISGFSEKTGRESPYYPHWFYVSGLMAEGVNEVAIMGKQAIKKNLELQKKYLPGMINMGSVNEEDLPLLENKLQEDKTLIYVCTNRTCKMPVEDVEKALKLIK